MYLESGSGNWLQQEEWRENQGFLKRESGNIDRLEYTADVQQINSYPDKG